MPLYTKPLKWLAPLLAVVAPAAVSGQTLRGSVLDSMARTPIVGAVVEARDSAGRTLTRGLTDAQGAYVVGRPAGVRQVRVVRMGYRPREVAVPEMVGSEQRVDVSMMVIPTFLETVNAESAPNCPRRADSQRAFALLEQARVGLLATIVSSESNAPAIKILRYDRTSDGDGQRILSQSVHIDSVSARTSFEAVRTARGFVDSGFVTYDRNGAHYNAPDALVLLDTSFAEAYCFRVRAGRTVAEIGLGFSPARVKKDRVDIDGTLWLDTAAKVVREIAFDYVGARSVPHIRPGGSISFRAMPNGATFIDRWYVRMVDYRADTSSGEALNGQFRGEAVRYYNYQRTSGGEVARATWPDGQEWRNSLGTARLRVVDKFSDKVTRAVLRLTDTDYLASPDSTGTVVIQDLLPGPYKVELQDSALTKQQIIMKSVSRFNVERGQLIVRTVVSPPTYVFFREACKKGWSGIWIELTAIDDEKHPVQVKWTLGEDLGGRFEHEVATGVTARDGTFGYCRDKASTKMYEVRMERVSDATKIVVSDVPSEPGRKPWTIIMPLRFFLGTHE